MARGDGSSRSKRKKKSGMCLFYRAINEDQQGSNISSKEVEAEVTLTGRMNLRRMERIWILYVRTRNNNGGTLSSMLTWSPGRDLEPVAVLYLIWQNPPHGNPAGFLRGHWLQPDWTLLIGCRPHKQSQARNLPPRLPRPPTRFRLSSPDRRPMNPSDLLTCLHRSPSSLCTSSGLSPRQSALLVPDIDLEPYLVSFQTFFKSA